MAAKKKVTPKNDIVENIEEGIKPLIVEDTKAQYENRREFEVIVSEKQYYNFNWLSINKKFRKFLESIKKKSDEIDSNKISKFKEKIKNIKFERKFNLWKNYCKIWNKIINERFLWKKYCEIWNKYFNIEFYDNSIGYENYLKFLEIGDEKYE